MKRFVEATGKKSMVGHCYSGKENKTVGYQTCVQFRLAYSIGAGYSTVRHAQVIAKAYESDIFAILGVIFRLIFPEPQTVFDLY